MRNHLFAIADIWPGRREFIIFGLCIGGPILLVLMSIVVYRDFKSHQRQEKRWVWYKRSSVICTISALSGYIASAFIYGTGVTKTIPDNLFTTTLIWVTLLAALALGIYNQALSSRRTKR